MRDSFSRKGSDSGKQGSDVLCRWQCHACLYWPILVALCTEQQQQLQCQWHLGHTGSMKGPFPEAHHALCRWQRRGCLHRPHLVALLLALVQKLQLQCERHLGALWRRHHRDFQQWRLCCSRSKCALTCLCMHSCRTPVAHVCQVRGGAAEVYPLHASSSNPLGTVALQQQKQVPPPPPTLHAISLCPHVVLMRSRSKRAHMCGPVAYI